MMDKPDKPLPAVDDDILPFWEGTQRHQLLLHRCNHCGATYFAASYCTGCDVGFNSPWADNMAWAEAAGRGKVFSFDVIHRLYNEAFKDDLPYNLAVIELDEGPLMVGNIVGCANQDISFGMPVEVVFDDITPEVTLPRWRPVPAAS